MCTQKTLDQCAAYGQSSSDYAVVDNVLIYYAILPAEMLRTFAPGSAEGRASNRKNVRIQTSMTR